MMFTLGESRIRAGEVMVIHGVLMITMVMGMMIMVVVVMVDDDNDDHDNEYGTNCG